MLFLLNSKTQIYKLIILGIFLGIISLFASKEILAQTAPDFGLSVSPSSATIQPGSSANFSISVTRQGNFNSTVNFSGASSGGLTVSFSPSSVVPPATVTMTVSTSSTIASGTYTINVSGSGGGITKSISVSVTVPPQSFTLSASPSSVQVIPGNNAVFTISANNPPNGRSLNVSLTASGQLGVSFSSSSINTPGTTTMTVNVPANTVPGIYTINVVGTASGTISQNTLVTVDVRPAPDFTLSVFPSMVSLPAGEQTELVLSVVGGSRFEDTVNLRLDSQLSASLSSNSVAGSGTVALTVSTSRSTAIGDYQLTVIGTSSTRAGIIEKRVVVRISVTAPPDFTLALSPSSIETSPGKSVSVSISVNSLNQFSDIVVLSFNTSNSNITATSNAPGILPGMSANATINVAASTVPGIYNVVVIGMAGGLQRTSMLNLTVSNDFDLTLSPTSQSIFVGQKTTFVVNVNGKDGFNGQVSLSVSSPQNTIQTSFSSLTINSTGNSTVTITTSPQTEPKDYPIVISAISGGISKTATFNLTVKANPGDFTLNLKPDIQTVSAGKSTSVNLDIQSQNGFNDLVDLRAEKPGEPIEINFAPPSARPGQNVSITISTTANTPRGTYTVRIIGTSGSLAKTATLTLNVTPAQDDVFSFAISPSTQDIIISDSAMYRVGIVGRSGFNQMVDLTAVSASSDVLVNFAKATLAPGSNTTLTAITNVNTAPGVYPITITGKAGSIVVTQQVNLTVRVAALQVFINFDPPPVGEISPPQNVKVLAVELKTQPKAQEISRKIHPLVDPNIAGFKLYRLPQPAEGLPALTEKDLVKDENLIATLSANDTSFVDTVNTGKNTTSNFVYSVSTFFGNGQSSSGSQPTSTNLPVINNPVFSKGTILVESASSFIQTGAVLIVDGMDEFPLIFDSSGTRFTVAKKKTGSINGKTLKKLITKGTTVQLTVKNPDGKLSISRSLTRAK